MVFERIYENLKEEFGRYGLEDAESEFIKDMMEGCRSADDRKVWNYFEQIVEVPIRYIVFYFNVAQEILLLWGEYALSINL